MSPNDFHSDKLVQTSKRKNKSSQYKAAIIILGIIMLVALIMFRYTRYTTYLDTLVYQPIGTVSEDAANWAKWKAVFLILPYLLLAWAGHIVAPLCLVLAVCFWKHQRRRFILITIALIFGVIILFTHLERSRYKRIFRDSFTAVTIRVQNLISAIEAYKEAKGNYPSDLKSLVPEFISEIPNTGLAGYPTFEYRKADTTTIFKQYELLIKTPSGGINWDVFVYWPEGNYPEYFYGGYPERIEEWVYVHE